MIQVAHVISDKQQANRGRRKKQTKMKYEKRGVKRKKGGTFVRKRTERTIHNEYWRNFICLSFEKTKKYREKKLLM